MREVFPVREKSGNSKILTKIIEESANFGSVRKIKRSIYMESIKIVVCVPIFLKY